MPLTFDMPWDELQRYPGTNPCPDDLDTYWQQGLDEIAALDARIEWSSAPFQTEFAECLDLTFTGVRGARIHAKVLRPRLCLKSLSSARERAISLPGKDGEADDIEHIVDRARRRQAKKGPIEAREAFQTEPKQTSKPHPAVIMFHGYTANSGNWTDKLGYVAAGFTVAALDCRGQGGLSEDVGGVQGTTMRGQIIRGLDGPPDNLLFRHIFLDTAQLTHIIMTMEDVDPTRIGVTGASQGGGLSLACAALVPKVARVAPVFPFLCDYQRVWEIDQAQDAYFELQDYFRRFDPLHRRETEVFTKLGYIDVQHLAKRIQGKVLMATALMDTICPPSTQFAAYNKITAEKSLRVYPDFTHEALPGNDDAVFQFMMEMA